MAIAKSVKAQKATAISIDEQLQPIGSVVDVPIISCRIAPENVRTKRKTDDVEALAANIKEYGLINALVGYQVGDAYFITAGGRRLRALELLKVDTVPVKVRARANAVEISLSENAQRSNMHPADEAVAFAEMVKKGGDPVAIANAFGVKERYVQQRIKLAGLHKPILQALAEDQISIETAEQYAGAPIDRQPALWKKLGKSPWSGRVRQELLQGNVDGGSREAQFVGAEAYEAAGGRIERDLFAERGHAMHGVWLDKKVLDKLVAEKLESTVERVRKEGWGFVEVGGSYWEAYERVDGAASSKELKAKRGAHVAIGHDGRPDITRNLVKRGQAKAAARATAKANGETADADVPPMTKSAHESLTRTASKIVAYACVKNPRIALAALTASLARNEFDFDASDLVTGEEVIHVNPESGWHARGGHDGAQPIAHDEELEAIRNAWKTRLEPHAANLETHLATLDAADLDGLLGFLLALQIYHVELYGERALARQRLGTIGRLAGADPLAFTPSAEFLKGYSAPELTKIATALGLQATGKKKGELAGMVAAAAPGACWVPSLVRELCGDVTEMVTDAPAKPKRKAKAA